MRMGVRHSPVGGPSVRTPDDFGQRLEQSRNVAVGKVCEVCDVMSLPREILPGRFYKITRRTVQRMFLLRPDDETNNAFLYCLGVAAKRCGVEVLLPCVMSNHHHTEIYDRKGTVVEFVEHLHKLMARSQNVLRGRSENMWSSEEVSIVQLVDPADVIDKLVYTATNPVKDGLVEKVHHWPGVNGFSDLVNQRTIRAKRPRHFFREDGPMPAEITLELTIPPELGEAAEVLAVLRERVAAFEESKRLERLKTGRSVLGRRRVLRQSPFASPTTESPRREIRPRVAARSRGSRIEALLRNRVFIDRYRAARVAWLAGASVEFPPGTYWLRRFAGVTVAPDTRSTFKT